MPRTKANVLAAVARKKAELVQKAAQPVGAEKRKAKRSRMWRTKWFRQVRHAQSNKAAGLNYLNAAGMSRLVREISAQQRPDFQVRWKPEAIMALREEAQERITEIFKVANAITVTCGAQTIAPKQFRLAAQILGMELPAQKTRTLVAQRPDRSASAPSSDGQTGKTESAS